MLYNHRENISDEDIDEDAQEIIDVKQDFRAKYKLNQSHKLKLPSHMRHTYNLFH